MKNFILLNDLLLGGEVAEVRSWLRTNPEKYRSSYQPENKLSTTSVKENSLLVKRITNFNYEQV